MDVSVRAGVCSRGGQAAGRFSGDRVEAAWEMRLVSSLF
jgi:hypothetical protein